VKNRLCFAGSAFALFLSASLNGANENAIASRSVMVDEKVRLGFRITNLAGLHSDMA